MKKSNLASFQKSQRKKMEQEQQERREKAQAFIDEFQAVVQKHNLTFEAFLDFKEGQIKPLLRVTEYKPEPPNVAKWSSSLIDNLQTRKNCAHQDGEGDKAGRCTTCGLNKEHWGSDGQGVTEAYQESQKKKIANAAATEAACAVGEHELNVEAQAENELKVKPEKPAMRFCVHCRKPENDWEK